MKGRILKKIMKPKNKQTKKLTDLTQPAGGSRTQTVKQADAGLPASKIDAERANKFDKALAKKENKLADMRRIADAIPDRKEKIAFLAKNKTEMEALKASIKEMKSRGGPGGRKKVRRRAEGGPLKNMDKKSPDFTQGLDKKFSAKVAEQNKKALKGNQKKLDANNDGKITGADFEILRKNPDAKKKYGGKISYRMTGGQVVDSTYD
tara:strand:+ start:70 stop:690 length:621 start_codon:yes stop_codon:yes gene_type:complete